MLVTFSGMRLSRGTPIDGTAPSRLTSKVNRSSSVILASVSRARASIAAASAGLNGIGTEGWVAEGDGAPGGGGSDDPEQPMAHVATTGSANNRARGEHA